MVDVTVPQFLVVDPDRPMLSVPVTAAVSKMRRLHT